MTKFQYDVLDIDELDYGGLIRELSAHDRVPCSLHIRNSLLAPFGAALPHESLRGSGESGSSPENSSEPWRVYKDYRPGVQLAAIGNVPRGARRKRHTTANGTASHASHADEQAEDQMWALVILAPVYAPGWVPHDATYANDTANPMAQKHWSGLRLNLWLSTETSLDVGAPARLDGGSDVLAAVRHPSPREQQLIRFIVDHYLAEAVVRYTRARNALGQADGTAPTYLPLRNETGKQAILDLYAVNHMWVKELKRLSGDRSTRVDLRVRRSNPCLSNYMLAKDARKLSQGVKPTARWQVDKIADDVDELKLVRDANSICFPLWYIERRRHLSAMIIDGKRTDDITAKAYPADVAAGQPVGWAYAHDDFSIASLHVAAPYRRIKHASSEDALTSRAEQSVGALCVAHMATQLVDAQHQAMRLSGVCSTTAVGDGKDALPCPCFADTELDKGPARSFFAKLGFTAFSVSTWGAISVTDGHD